MKILFAAGEAVPFAATGGLADVAGSLPKALNEAGADCRVVMPLYSDIPEELRNGMHFLTSFDVSLAWRTQYCGVFETNFGGVVFYFLDNEYYFKRAGLYGQYDDAERFAFFSRAVPEMTHRIGFEPDIIHANDWHTSLIPAFLRASPTCGGGPRSVLTIHNVRYQGIYDMSLLRDILGVDEKDAGIFEFSGGLNYLKAGIVTADAVTTVSPAYAAELRDPYFAYGLDSIFSRISGRLSGILNGIDTTAYDPASDSAISAPYSASDPGGKGENRRVLQRELGLPEDGGAFIAAVVSRLVADKGLDLICFAMDEIMTMPVQFVVLGSGEPEYERRLSELAAKYPAKLAVRFGFRSALARQIYAGADALLMPSRSEPCGLAQMIAMRYGTVPIVHAVGGLKDSVTDCGGEGGTGFTFQSFNAGDMMGAFRRAENLFRDRDVWQTLLKRDMAGDFSWEKSAGEYLKIYGSLLA